jgi:carbon storage regulator CsrA
MLVLSRKPGEKVVIGNGIAVTIVEVKGNRVRVGIDAPDEVRILRAELDGDMAAASALLSGEIRRCAYLAFLKQLRSLSLYNTKVTDAGVKELASFKLLLSLDLSNTKVTDTGLPSLTQIQSLDLSFTKVTG